MRIITGFWLALVLLTSLSCGDKPDVYDVSIPNLKISPDQSVTSFQINVNAGSIVGTSNIPVGWNVLIEDDVSWRSRVKANATAGAASLSAEELKRLIFVVRRNEGAAFKFDVSGSSIVSKNFEDPKKMPLAMADFSLVGTQ